MDDTALEFARYTPTTGSRPEAENEIIADTKTLDAHSDILAYTYPADNDYSGVASAYVMFRGNGDIEVQLHQLPSETGYTCDTMGGSKEDGNYVIARVSPAYQSGTLTDNLPC